MKQTNTIHCSFCGKSQHEVRKLIAGSSVFICDECAELCAEIIREGRFRLIYENDFSSSDNRWFEGIQIDGVVRAFRCGGFYHIAFLQPKYEDYFYYFYPEMSVADFKITVDAGLDPEFIAQGSADAYYGIVFRGKRDSDGRHFYYVFTVSRYGYFSLFRYSPPSQSRTTVVDSCFSHYIGQEDSINTLVVEAEGEKITIEANKHTLLVITDTNSGLKAGYVGLLVGTTSRSSLSRARFRNFELYEIEA